MGQIFRAKRSLSTWPPNNLDLAIRGDKIVAITPGGALPFSVARQRIDATPALSAPGFIDIQNAPGVGHLKDGPLVGLVTQASRGRQRIWTFVRRE
jgi:N-acyl-D-aspartate/D-glutamate deacylase